MSGRPCCSPAPPFSGSVSRTVVGYSNPVMAKSDTSFDWTTSAWRKVDAPVPQHEAVASGHTVAVQLCRVGCRCGRSWSSGATGPGIVPSAARVLRGGCRFVVDAVRAALGCETDVGRTTAESGRRYCGVRCRGVGGRCGWWCRSRGEFEDAAFRELPFGGEFVDGCTGLVGHYDLRAVGFAESLEGVGFGRDSGERRSGVVATGLFALGGSCGVGCGSGRSG